MEMHTKIFHRVGAMCMASLHARVLHDDLIRNVYDRVEMQATSWGRLRGRGNARLCLPSARGAFLMRGNLQHASGSPVHTGRSARLP